mgnify:CR=1 FL=1
MVEDVSVARDVHVLSRVPTPISVPVPMERLWSREDATDGNGDKCSKRGRPFEGGDAQAKRERYEQGAAAGEPNAMFRLAQLLEDSDPQAAREWFERAAAAGYTAPTGRRRSSELAFSPCNATSAARSPLPARRGGSMARTLYISEAQVTP